MKGLDINPIQLLLSIIILKLTKSITHLKTIHPKVCRILHLETMDV